MSIGARIRQLRKAHQLSQERFGELCNVTKGLVSQWESDQAVPTVDRLMAIHERIAFSFDWLLSGENSYSVSDPKLIAVVKAMEPAAEYEKDALVKVALTNKELAQRARQNGTGGKH